MHIVFLTKQPFPFGEAEINRQISYAKEMVRMGHQVTFLCLQSHGTPQTNPSNNQARGKYLGIDFIYTEGSPYWPDKASWVRKQWLHTKSYLQSLLFLFSNRNNIDIIQIYNGDLQMFHLYSQVSKFFKKPLVHERSELPDIVKQKDKLERTAKGKKYINSIEKAFGVFDGWILETQTLVDYYLKFAKKEAKHIIAPMTVEIDRFSGIEPCDLGYGKYIAYCGNMREVDGISILIKAFAQIAPKYLDYKLLLAGVSDEMEAQKKLVKEKGLEDRVVFLGRLSRDEVPPFLSGASVLALASPLSARASATMPCKVGEYLCTKKPVVVTGQGELFKYLADGKNAFLAVPDSEDSFALKLDEVLSNYPRALGVAEEGFQVPLKYFNSTVQAQRIVELYKKLVQ